MHSLYEVASFLRDNLITPHGDFSVEGVPFEGFAPDLLRKGVMAFHTYTHDLYTFFVENTETYDVPLKTAKGDFPSLGQGYPILQNAFLVLYLIGVSGIPNEDGTALLVEGTAFREAVKAMRITKVGDILAMLRKQGIGIEGDIAKSAMLIITYPALPIAPLGLAAMAQASRRYAEKPADKGVVTDRFMMRFDYRVLSGAKNPTAPIEECLGAAPAEIRDFLLLLNERFAKEGCKRQMTSNLFVSKCAYRPKNMTTTFFTIHANFGRYWIKINAEHLAEYLDFLEDAPEDLRDKVITEPWPCAKKDDPSACSPNCRGGIRFNFHGKDYMPCRMGAFRLPIGDATEREFALRWINTELAAM